MKKFRIKKVDENRYHVQQRYFWLFWITWDDGDFPSPFPLEYKSEESAREAIEKYCYRTQIIEA